MKMEGYELKAKVRAGCLVLVGFFIIDIVMKSLNPDSLPMVIDNLAYILVYPSVTLLCIQFLPLWQKKQSTSKSTFNYEVSKGLKAGLLILAYAAAIILIASLFFDVPPLMGAISASTVIVVFTVITSPDFSIWHQSKGGRH
ncbi:hypothetical protein M9194_10580 [Vibrio sp. S4M6]|uniref:hypothetical protein n=1 Tax=Vibrio sinus TaxID=2946865 RepID=UPI002029C771|nr:hypothetical protein [Vibrio sinus]MCL9781873.1 hypothetical protein [Vibrio sinus]